MLNKNNFIKIQKEIGEYSKPYIENEEIKKFNQHIETKLADFKPTLMVYGTYNAGKSTLLNALFGQEEMAKTGDSPETAQVHGYEYNGYTIYDTPGINAPIEHEEVTKEHLQKSEIIIFVLSNDGSLEEEYIYEKISEIVKSSKPIIIVLNNKRGVENNSVEALQEIDKVNINLSKIGDRNGIDQIEGKVQLCMLNAKSALKGKVEKKQIILKKSNIVELETMISSTLQKSGNIEVVNALTNYIKSFIDNVIQNVDNKIDIEEIKKIEELITYIEKSKQKSEVNLKSIIHKKTLLLKENVVQVLSSDTPNHVEKVVTDFIDTIIQEIEIEVENIQKNLQNKLGEFSLEIREINPEYEIHIDNNDMSDEFILPDDIKNKIIEAAKNKDLVKAGTEEALKLAKKYLPDLMKGKGPVWMGKAAGKAASGITLALSAYDIYSAQKEMNEQIKQERNKVLSIQNSATSISNDIESSFQKNIYEIISEVFDDLLNKYHAISDALNIDNKQMLEDKQNLQNLINQISSDR